MKRSLTILASIGTVMALSGSASAQQPCRTTEDANNAVLTFFGFSNNALPGDIMITMGQVPFFGGSIIAACIVDFGAGTETLHAVVDGSTSALASLPKQFNHICLTDESDDFEIVESNRSVCGVTMSPLNYAGRAAVIYGGFGNDHIHGGSGSEIIFGGVGDDNLSDANGTSNPLASGSIIFGESGNDRIFGSTADNTWLLGGPGVDGLRDFGGTLDLLAGNEGNDCCLWDSNNVFQQVDCGSGTDVVQNFSGGKLNCETVDARCNGTLAICN